MNFVTKAALSSRRIAIAAFVTIGGLSGLGASDALVELKEPPGLGIGTLSSRPDMVSGGDALVEVQAPAGAQLKHLTLTLNGKDVTSRLKLDAASGRFRGLIGGMAVGENTLVAKLKSPRAAQASLEVTNHPITGPILSGPHLTPYECRTVESGLGEPLDADWNTFGFGKIRLNRRSNTSIARRTTLSNRSRTQPGRAPLIWSPRRPTMGEPCPTSCASTQARSIAASTASRSLTIRTLRPRR